MVGIVIYNYNLYKHGGDSGLGFFTQFMSDFVSESGVH